MLQSAQDMQCVENCDDPDPKRHVLYEQPVWQTLQMFRTSPHISPRCPPIWLTHTLSTFVTVGEMLCMSSFPLPFALFRTLIAVGSVLVRLYPSSVYHSIGALAYIVRPSSRRIARRYARWPF